MAWLSAPADVSAKGFVGHGFAGHHHRSHHHHGPRPGDWIAVYPEPVTALPADVGPVNSIAPRCTHSVETVTVPSEDGGERTITIKRC